MMVELKMLAINSVALIGLLSLGALPIQIVYMSVRYASGFKVSRTSWLLALMMALGAGMLILNVLMISKILECLTNQFCGPNSASGLIYLAIFGSIVLIFEILQFVLDRWNYALTKAGR